MTDENIKKVAVYVLEETRTLKHFPDSYFIDIVKRIAPRINKEDLQKVREIVKEIFNKGGTGL